MTKHEELRGLVGKWLSIGSDPNVQIQIRNLHAELADELSALLAGEAPAQRVSEKFAIVATGEGAQARIADEANLRDQLHELMCVCGAAWGACKTEGVLEAIETLDDENNWQNDDDGRPFSVHVLQAEISDVMVYRLNASLGAEREAEPYANYFKNAVCFTCEGESGQPPSKTVDICEKCHGDEPAATPAAALLGKGEGA